MPGILRLRRLESLLILATRLAGESGGGVLGDSLDMLLDTTNAKAGAAFAMIGGEALDQVAERGLGATVGDRSQLRSLLRTVAEKAVKRRRPLWIDDVGSAKHKLEDAPGLSEIGLSAILAVPIEHQRSPLGALLLMFMESGELDDEAAAFAETVAHMLALALDREHRLEREDAEREENDEARRMAGLGLLTASVAHELRGPVGALVLQLDEQRRLLEQITVLGGSSDTALGGTVAELGELTRDIDAAVARIRRTTEQLSTLSHHDNEPEELDLATVVRESLSVARPHLEHRGITLIEQLDPDCFTTGHPDNLGQVVLNLVFNAADACEQSAGRHHQISVRAQPEGEHVMLLVEDTGPGVPDNAVRMIFEPFYSTKQRGKGTGLGLKICSDVVSAHGGHIEVQNRAEGGAAFRVVLPRTDDSSGVFPVGQAGPAPQREPLPVAPRRILVVDDDPVFARSIRRALRPHDVRTAASASEAEIALLDKSWTPDVVLCDVFLPGANGNALHARIASSQPELAERFVFVTGGALGKTEADYIRRSGCRTLLKPVSLSDLRESIEVDSVDSTPPHSVRTLNPPSGTGLPAVKPPKKPRA